MIKRNFGRTGLKVPVLGFGTMRLPLKDGSRGFTGISSGNVDRDKSIELIRYAVERGVNYIDTAYNYLDGDSEHLTGEALEGGLRKQAMIATKAPAWLYRCPDDFDRYLDEQLSRLRTDYIDVYLLHGMNQPVWEKKVLRHHILDRLQKAKEQGIVKTIGFSFHDSYDLFTRIVDADIAWDMCQIQLNYYDKDYQAGMKGLAYAAGKGMGMAVMEPLRGGYLNRLPLAALEAFKAVDPEKTPVEWAFDYLWNRPEISVVLSGMGDKAEIDENIRFAERSGPFSLSEVSLAAYERVCESLRSFHTVPCTGCCYCVPVCPKHVAIPYSFFAYNDLITSGDRRNAGNYYHLHMNRFGNKADACIGCRRCEEMCPQHIAISEWMPKISEAMCEKP